jgi:two-component system, NtrC family, response regulator HydG
MYSILVVDDNLNLQKLLKITLEKEGYQVTLSGNGLEALEIAASASFDLVILDMRLPGLNGMKVLEKLKQMDNDLVVIMITAFANIKTSIEAMKLGAFNYLIKPVNVDEMILNVKKGLEPLQLKAEIKDLKHKLTQVRSELIVPPAESPQMKQVLKKVGLIAETDYNVIIHGKSGTGKEVIARFIHSVSHRKNHPFVTVDCGAIPEQLFESEMFGHRKGAFTGANRNQKGKFEAANSGTLFLDEITNLPLNHQAKLLRAIQEKRIQRVGDERSFKLNIRLLVASNRDILEEVYNGNFREDLYHRLNEFVINLPLLKDRNEDISSLVEVFLQEVDLELGKKITGLSYDALQLLLHYDFPGNVRELRQLIRKAALVSEGRNIEASAINLPETEPQNLNHYLDTEDYLQKIISADLSLKQISGEISSRVEKNIICQLLEKVNHNKTKAARILGIDRTTLYQKMK